MSRRRPVRDAMSSSTAFRHSARRVIQVKRGVCLSSGAPTAPATCCRAEAGSVTAASSTTRCSEARTDARPRSRAYSRASPTRPRSAASRFGPGREPAPTLTGITTPTP